MPNVGPMEIVGLLLLALLLFGAKRLPEIGRSLGSGMREFKDSVSGEKKPEPRSELPPPVPAAPVPTAEEAAPAPTSSPDPGENEPPAAASA
jgi:sec-independent protein translocase protein TatA